LTLESIEGMTVSMRPPAGKLLHVHCWNPDVPSSDDLVRSHERRPVQNQSHGLLGVEAARMKCRSPNDE